MKILFVHCTYKFKGGEGTVVEEEMKLLQSAGNTVQLLSFSNVGNEISKLLQLPFNLSAYYKTITVLKAFQPDIVHIHNLHFGASASVIYAVKKRKVPLVVTLHNFRLLCPSATLFFEGKPFLDSLKPGFPWSAVRKGVYQDSLALTFWLAFSMQLHNWLQTWRLPDKLIVLSQHGKQVFSRCCFKIERNTTGGKTQFQSPPFLTKAARSHHFLFIGRLSTEKGLELLLETFAQTGYRLKIAGDGPLQQKVIGYSANFSNIEYLGILQKESVNIALQSCSALVFPSIWYEGMPLTIIEALACGTPVIASKLGAMQTMITDGFNGLHFNPESPDEFKSQLKKWMEMGKEQKEAFGINARNTYEQNYTPEKNAAELVAIYHSIIPHLVAAS